MSKTRRFPVFPFVLAASALALSGCGGKAEKGKQAAGAEAEKIELVLMIELATSPLVREKVIPMIRARFPGISIVSRIRDDAQVENIIKN